MQERVAENERLTQQLQERQAFIEQLQAKAKECIDAKANDKLAQLSEKAAKEMRTLRDNNEALKAREALLAKQLAEKDAVVSMLQEQVRTAETEQSNLGKQNSKLMMSKNPQAKTQYLDSLRNELNGAKKEIIRLQEEIKGLKRSADASEKAVQSLQSSTIRPFCNNICKVLEMPTVTLPETSDSMAGAQAWEARLQAYFALVLKQAQKGAAQLKRSQHSQSFTNVLNQSTDAISNTAGTRAGHKAVDISSSFIQEQPDGNMNDSQSSDALSFDGSKMFAKNPNKPVTLAAAARPTNKENYGRAQTARGGSNPRKLPGRK